MLINPNNIARYQAEVKRLNQTPPHLTWLNALRQLALDHFLSIGFPTQKLEDWKFTRVEKLAQTDFSTMQGALLTHVDYDTLGHATDYTASVMFNHGHFQSIIINPEYANQIVACSIHEALQKEPEIVQQHLKAHLEKSDHGFSALNTALFNDGFYLRIPEHCHLTAPIYLYFLSTSEQPNNHGHIRNLIIADESSSATITEIYCSPVNASQINNVVTDISLATMANISHFKLIEGKSDSHIGTTFVDQAPHSHYQYLSFCRDINLARSDINIQLLGKEASCHLNGMYLLRDKQHVDHHTCIDHVHAHTLSHENFKGILDDSSHGVFNGKIIVRPNSQKIVSHQSNKNLLLSSQAEINTKPELEIYADDVKCSHGATVGQISEEALFYLRSRGIPLETARTQLIEAFMQDILNEITQPHLRQSISRYIQQHFHPEQPDLRQ